MDKEIPIEEIRRRRIRRILLWGAIPMAVIGGAAIAMAALLGKSVKESSLTFAVTDVGNVENSVVASGKVVPAYEEVMVSPVATRIMEVYCQEGETVDYRLLSYEAYRQFVRTEEFTTPVGKRFLDHQALFDRLMAEHVNEK